MSVDPRPQESEGLKRIYGLKFFYLVEDKKSFFTLCYANGKDVIVCGHEIPMYITLTAPLPSENIAAMEMGSRCSILTYGSSGLMNSVFTISFFSLKVKIYTMKVFWVYSFKNEFLSDGKTISLSLKKLSFLT